VPVAGPEFAKCPNQTLRSQAISDVFVFRDIARVIKINKIKLLHLPVDRKCGGKKKENNDLYSIFLIEDYPDTIPAWLLFYFH
jgi:hypothetical protein